MPGPATHEQTAQRDRVEEDQGQAEDLASLRQLAAELTARAYLADLRAPVDGPPFLDVRNPRANVLAERVYAQAGVFWWSWREPIAACDQVTTAADLLVRVLRALGE
jgi:hypothetical protein